MRKKIIEWVKAGKEWLVAGALLLTVVGFVWNTVYANWMAPKVKIQIEDEIKPYNTRLCKIENRVEWLVFIVERNINRDTLADLRREYFMRKRTEEE